MEILQDYISIFIVIACNVAGYILKNWSILKGIDNKDIPVYLCMLGGVLGLLTMEFSLQGLIAGCVSGIASVGMYEAFIKKLSNGDSSH